MIAANAWFLPWKPSILALTHPSKFQPNATAETSMEFALLGEIMNVETFASGRGIRNLALLNKKYGLGKWRKRKGVALIQLKDGSECLAELHWFEYEATPICDLCEE